MKMIEKDGKPDQINPKQRRQPLQLQLDPDLAMVVVLSGDESVPSRKHRRTTRFITWAMATYSGKNTYARASCASFAKCWANSSATATIIIQGS